MKFTVTGSVGNVGKPLIQKLVAAGHDITVISSQADRTSEIEAMGAKAAIGSVTDASFLKNVFIGADAVYTMTPPKLGGDNIIANVTHAGGIFASAIRESGVKRVVMLSSLGAHLSKGNGPISGLHNIEQIYNQLEGVAVTYLRAGMFYNNFYNSIPMIKGMNIIGNNYPATTQVPFVHPIDIATAISEELQKVITDSNVRYIISDVKSPAEAAKILGAAIGKPELSWVEFTDEQSVQGMLRAGLSAEIAELYTEMGIGLRTGIIPEDFQQRGSPVTGQVKLEDFAQEFASKF
jgi:uncharacterized protein YbjT (DUF2867 family)